MTLIITHNIKQMNYSDIYYHYSDIYIFFSAPKVKHNCPGGSGAVSLLPPCKQVAA